MFQLPMLIAWRYLKAVRNKQSIGTMISICFISMLFGTLALALSLFIMSGFEEATRSKLQSINPQLIIRAQNAYLNEEKMRSILEKEFPAIQAFAPSDTRYAMLEVEQAADISNVVIVKGIDPTKEAMVTNINSIILNEPNSLSTILVGNHIIIGEKLAHQHGLHVGSTATLLFAPEAIYKRKLTLNSQDITIGAIFKTGIDEFDAELVICSLNFLTTMFPDAHASQLGVKLKPNTDEVATIQALRKRFHVEVYSWLDLYKPLASALLLEKYVMFFILSLLVALASMNVISLLFMLITQKQRDIAILYAMGMPVSAIKKIFLIVGIIIAFLSTISGLGLAMLIGKFLQWYPLIELPDVYYVANIPIVMQPLMFVIIFFVVMCIACIATWLPTRNITNMQPSHILRFK